MPNEAARETDREAEAAALRDELQRLRQDVSQLTATVRSITGDAASRAAERAREAGAAVTQRSREHPFASALVLFSLGLIAGFLVSRTRGSEK